MRALAHLGWPVVCTSGSTLFSMFSMFSSVPDSDYEDPPDDMFAHVFGEPDAESEVELPDLGESSDDDDNDRLLGANGAATTSKWYEMKFNDDQNGDWQAAESKLGIGSLNGGSRGRKKQPPLGTDENIENIKNIVDPEVQTTGQPRCARARNEAGTRKRNKCRRKKASVDPGQITIPAETVLKSERWWVVGQG